MPPKPEYPPVLYLLVLLFTEFIYSFTRVFSSSKLFAVIVLPTLPLVVEIVETCVEYLPFAYVTCLSGCCLFQFWTSFWACYLLATLLPVVPVCLLKVWASIS